nr:uncharacterized protein LOC122269208 [Parasteatoda tepidariorum]
MLVNKSHMSDQQLRAIALSAIENKYPRDTWLYIYTDGSLINDEGGARPGVSCDLFSCYSPVGAHSTHYDGEIETIYIALKQLAIRRSSFCRSVILLDSTYALQSFTNRQYTRNTSILESRKLVISISLSFHWIPTHSWIPGNKAADFLVKKGAGALQRPLKSLSFHSVKLLVKGRYNTRIKQKAYWKAK